MGSRRLLLLLLLLLAGRGRVWDVAADVEV